MTAKKQMYIGTEAGVVVMSHENGCWNQRGGGLKGKAINVLLASGDAGVVYGCTPKDGLFVSKDGGESWDLAFSGKVHTMALDPSNPKVIYAGTEPIRLLRSDNMGNSWTEIEGLQHVPEEARDRWWFPIYPHESHVRSIFVDWHNPKILCVGLEHGGIFRTEDGGENWENLSAGIEYLDIHMVMGDPLQENLYYAATARGFYRSDQFGRQWISSADGVSRDYFHDFVALPGAVSTLLVATANGTPPAWLRPGKAQSAIFRSNDCGESWHQLGGGLPDSMERMVWTIVRDPWDNDSVYASIGDYSPNLSEGETGYREVWTSHDRGEHWKELYKGPSPIRSVCVGL